MKRCTARKRPEETRSPTRRTTTAGLKTRRYLNIEHRNHWTVIARAELALHDTRCRARGDHLAGKHIVEPPSDVALFEIAPRRPPREQVGVVRVERPMDIDETVAEDLLDSGALIRALTNDAWAPFFRVHVRVCSRNVHVAAHDERRSRRLAFGRKLPHLLEEAHLRDEILAPVRYVNRRNGYVRERHGDDAMLEVEGRMLEGWWIGKRCGADVKRDARITLAAVPITRIALELANPDRQLIERRFDFLEAQDVRLLALDELLQFGLPCADPIDVPRGDFH